MDAAPVVPPLVAPDRLTAETTEDFRRQALRHVARCITSRALRVVVDLSHVDAMDATGATVLEVIRARAADYGLVTELVHPTRAVREAIGEARRLGLIGF